MSTLEQRNVQVAAAATMCESAFDAVFCCYDSLAQEFPAAPPEGPGQDRSPRPEWHEGVGSPPPPGRPDVEADMLAAYLDDARRCLGALEDALLALESEPNNADTLLQLCRHLHTLKGASATVGLHTLARDLHGLEDWVRMGFASGRPVDIDPMLQGVDAIRAQIGILSGECADGDEPTSETNSAEWLRRSPRRPDESAAADEETASVEAGACSAMVSSGEAVASSGEGSQAQSQPADAQTAAPELAEQVAPQVPTDGLGGSSSDVAEHSDRTETSRHESGLTPTHENDGYPTPTLPASGEGASPRLRANQAGHFRVRKPPEDQTDCTPQPSCIRPPLMEPGPITPADDVGGPTSERGAARVDETVRVEASRLDRLMDLLAELVIVRNRRDSRVAQLKQFQADLTRCAGRLRALAEGFSAAPTPSAALTRSVPSKSRDGCTGDADAGGLWASRPTGDDCAPALHSARTLAEVSNDVSELANCLRQFYEPLAEENLAVSQLMRQFRHELMELRRLPVAGLFRRLQRAARDVAREEAKQVRLEFVGEQVGLERSLQERLYEPLLHLVRNAVSHGVEPEQQRLTHGKPAAGTVALEARSDPTSLVIEVRDDGRGLDYEAIARRGVERGLLSPDRPASRSELGRLIFHPGFSTRNEVTAVSGRGVGMDVVASVVDRLRGQVEMDSTPGRGTSIRLRIPLRSVIEHVMVFRAGGELFALPMQFVQGADPSERENESNLPTLRLADVLFPSTAPAAPLQHVVLVGHGPRSGPAAETAGREGASRPGDVSQPALPPPQAVTPCRLALAVDGIVGPEEVVVRPLPPLFRRHRLFAGVTLSGAGEIVYVFDGWELIALGLGRTGRPAPPAQPGTPDGSVEEPSVSPTRVLVVDDSLSVRRSVNKLLTQRGFAVTEASNGLEALELLHTQSFSLIFTDVEMPRLGGLELLGELKRGRHARPQRVIVMSSCSDHETRARADQLGADAYLIKPATDAALGHLLSQLGLATR